jgi:tetratricopeptide (TPR) repeat protein
MPTLLDLRAASRAGVLTVFAGAGISAAAPSRLPLAKELIASAVNAIAQTVDAGTRDAALEATSKLRPEVFCETLIDLCGRRTIAFLNILSDALPNENHHRLARALSMGGTVITTNFDVLIEAASAQAGHFPAVFTPPSFSGTRPPSPGAVYKLHGTLETGSDDPIGGLAISVRQTARSRTPNLRRTLRSLLSRGVVVFVGYSGLDDFDINPILQTLDCDPLSTVWLNHAYGAGVPADGTELSDLAYPPPQQGAAALLRSGVYLDCETADFMRVLFPGEVDVQEDPPHLADQRSQRWSDWAQTLRLPPLAVLGAIALVADEAALAADCLRRALGEPGLSAASRGKIQLNLASALRRQGRPQEAIEICEAALARLDRRASVILRTELLQAIGAYRRVMSNWRGACKAYLGALKMLRGRRRGRPQRAELLNALAIALDKLGKTRTALRLLEPVYRAADRNGDLDLASRVSNNLGYMHQNIDSFEAALTYLEASAALKRLLGNTYGLGNTLHNIGWVHHVRGDLKAARTAYLSGLAVKKLAGANRHALAQTWSTLGDVCLQCGHPLRARVLLARALPILEAAPDAYGAAEVACGLAHAFANIGNADETRVWLIKARNMIEPLERTPEVGKLLQVLEAVEFDFAGAR